jgi:hypothetical protein
MSLALALGLRPLELEFMLQLELAVTAAESRSLGTCGHTSFLAVCSAHEVAFNRLHM